jgi:hypothetical protein
MLRGEAPLPLAIGFCAVGGALAVLALLVDRLVAPRLSEVLSTLVYPMASVTLAYLIELTKGGNFIGSWPIRSMATCLWFR